MKLYELNTKLLKTQQERIDQLERDNAFWRDLCKKLSQPIKHKKTNSKEPK
tara:strand:- start:163 stop:315 length:153 start_codon:yes stop_codon:yes gene_type:complete